MRGRAQPQESLGTLSLWRRATASIAPRGLVSRMASIGRVLRPRRRPQPPPPAPTPAAGPTPRRRLRGAALLHSIDSIPPHPHPLAMLRPQLDQLGLVCEALAQRRI